MHTLFISDLHLSDQHPENVQQFLRFTGGIARNAESLYILGDLFEYWAGDDDCDDRFNHQITGALQTLSRHVPIYFMHGNRDFLMLDGFSHASGASLIPDPFLFDLYGVPTLLTHGDSLCTDDVAYQEFRRLVRQSEWQHQFLLLPLQERKMQISGMRSRSEDEKQKKSPEIMDVNKEAVIDTFRAHGYPRMIHGHTHRRGVTQYQVDGRLCERWTLGDWETGMNALFCDRNGMKWITSW